MSQPVDYPFLKLDEKRPNTIIHIADDWMFYCYRKRPYNRLQRWLILRLFGWRIEPFIDRNY